MSKALELLEKITIETIKHSAELEQQLLVTKKLVADGKGAGMTTSELEALARNMEATTGYSRIEVLKSINTLLLKGAASRDRIGKTLLSSLNMAKVSGSQDIVRVSSMFGDAMNGRVDSLDNIQRSNAINIKQFNALKKTKAGGNLWDYKDQLLEAVNSNVGGYAALGSQGMDGLWNKATHEWFNVVRMGMPSSAGSFELPHEDKLKRLEMQRSMYEKRLASGSPSLGKSDRELVQKEYERLSKNIEKLKEQVTTDNSDFKHWAKMDALKRTSESFVESTAAQVVVTTSATEAATEAATKAVQTTVEKAASKAAEEVAKAIPSTPIGGSFKIDPSVFETGSWEYTSGPFNPHDTGSSGPWQPYKMDLPDVFGKGIDAWIEDFEEMGKTAENIFGDLGRDITGLVKRGEISLESFSSRLKGLWEDGNIFDLEKFFNSEDGSFELINLFSDEFQNVFTDLGADFEGIFKDGGAALDEFFGDLRGLVADNPLMDLFNGVGDLFGGTGIGDLFSSLSTMGGGLGDIIGSIGGGLGGLVGSIGSSIGGMFSGGGGWMSMIGSVASMFFHDGGFVGGPARSQLVPAALFAGAPRFHSGGFLGHGERPIIAKEGELILNAAQQRNVAGKMNGGVNVTVPVIVENHSNEKVQSQEESGPDGKKQIRMIVGEAVNKGIASGQFDTSMNRAYGLSRKGY